MVEDFERCYRAVRSRDCRFDGWFVTAVTTTGVYCRPSCPARTPFPDHVRFFPTAAAAQGAGFRACLRCRPDAAPGSPEWNVRRDVVARAMRMIADGVVDRDGVAGLSRRLGYGSRQLHRLLVAEVGAGPLALARTQRASAARLLIETTQLPMAAVAFAAGFASVRQFNDTVHAVFGRTPTALRRRRQGDGGVRPAAAPGSRQPGSRQPGSRQPGATPGALVLRLPYREPMAFAELTAFLGRRAVPGVESTAGGPFQRTLRLPHGHGSVALAPGAGHVRARLVLEDLRDLASAVDRCRRLLDLDADPQAVAEVLEADPALGPLVVHAPGRRVPGAVDGFELAVRAVIGQQVSLAAARTVAARLVAAAGASLRVPPATEGAPAGTLTHVFPAPEDVLDAPDAAFAMPSGRRRALRALATAVADGSLPVDSGADPVALRRGLLQLDGVGEWTAAYVAMRALGDPDAYLPGDLGVRRGLAHVGVTGDRAALAARAARWRPWRAYAVVHLWSASAPGATGTKEDAA